MADYVRRMPEPDAIAPLASSGIARQLHIDPPLLTLLLLLTGYGLLVLYSASGRAWRPWRVRAAISCSPMG